MMSAKQPKYTNWILECINLLRSRKSRPDIERICRTMQKVHGIDPAETEQELAILVGEGVVTKRSFKGAISYRNASGWGRDHLPQKVSRVGRWITQAIRELDHGSGAQALEVEKHVTRRHPYYKDLKPRIKNALKEGLDSGRIWRNSEGNYRLLEAVDESPEHELNSSEPLCDFCLQTSEFNRDGNPEDLLVCRDCGNKAHPSCMKYSPELTDRIRADNGSWQCIDCKSCIICNDSGDAETLMFCDACDKGYHMLCHLPKLSVMPTGTWMCTSCCEHKKKVQSLSLSSTQSNGTLEEPMETDNPVFSPVSSKPPSPVVVTSMEEQTTPTSIPSPTKKQSPLSPGSGKYHLQMLEECVEAVSATSQSEAFMAVDSVINSQADTTIPQQDKTIIIPSIQKMTPDTTTVDEIQPVRTPLTPKMNSSLLVPVMSTPPSPPKFAIEVEESLKKLDLPKHTASWTVDQVVSFFSCIGFTEEAKKFNEQEIDGKALLLMSRHDVMAGLSLKIGPALKMYVHISRLQAMVACS